MPSHTRKARPPAPVDPARAEAQALFERGLADLHQAHALALGACPEPERAHLVLAPPVPAQAQQMLAFDLPEPERPRAALTGVPCVSSASRLNPYERQDGMVMIKQSFRASEAFDSLWRKLDGALPRHVSKHVWIEQVLTNAIRAELARDAG